MKLELFIENNGRIYTPVALNPIVWTTERKGVPGKLEFTVLNDSVFGLEEGNTVTFTVDGCPLFRGYIFHLSYNKSRQKKIVAYDQMRYLKNKDTYVFKKKTASQIIKMIGNDFNLRLGEIEDTGYVIPKRIEDGTTLIDMILTALEITMTNTQRMYVLYDLVGELTLKNIEQMKLPILIDDETGEEFDYESSIEDSYNKIKLAYGKKSGKQKIYIAQDTQNITKWGILQYYEKINSKKNAQALAESYLKLYNAKSKSLKINKALGDLRVRGGSMIGVLLNLDDITVNNYMMVEQAVHYFDDEHRMNLILRGGDISG